jgi:hypothetical protein
MGVTEVVDQLVEGSRFLERIQIRSVEVFHQGMLEAARVGHRLDDDGNRLKAGAARRSPTPLTGDEFELAFSEIAHQDGLQQADFTDRSRE